MPAAAAIPLAFAVGGAAIGASVIQGAQQASAQKKALRSQQEAQRLATSRATAEARRQEMEQRRANRKQPDVGSLLGAEQQHALSGPGATTLTGAGGVGTDRLTLARSSLLGSV